MTIASIALTAAGAVAQQQGQANARKATQQANLGEVNRQQDYQNRSFNQYDKSLGYNQADSQKQRENDASANLSNLFGRDVNNAFLGVDGTGDNMASAEGAPKVIADTYKNVMGDARSRIQAQLAGKAQMGGFSDMLAKTGIQNQDITNNQAALGGFMKGSSAVLPLELVHAGRAGDQMNGLGAMLQLAGLASGMYGSASAASNAKAALATTNSNRAAMGLSSVSSPFPAGTVGPGTW